MQETVRLHTTNSDVRYSKSQTQMKINSYTQQHQIHQISITSTKSVHNPLKSKPANSITKDMINLSNPVMESQLVGDM